MANKVQQITFATMYAPNEMIPSPPGEHIYKWQYLDEETGKLVDDERNVYEQIQSFRRQVDYKQQIKNGEEFINENGIYMDTTKLGTDSDGIAQYLTNLVGLIQGDLQKPQAQIAETSETSPETTPPVQQNQTETTQEGGSE